MKQAAVQEAPPSGVNQERARGLLWVFLAVSILYLFADTQDIIWLAYATKPALMLLLLTYVAINTQAHPSKKRMLALAALLMACSGDTWLMLQSSSGDGSLFFLLGLGSFLLTQLAYTWLFSLTTGFREGLLSQQPLLAAPLVFYWILLMILLWPGIPPGMGAPIVVYGLVITSMTLTAYHLRPLLSKRIYQPLLLGVLLFLLSDSLIGLNRFRPDIGPIWQAHFFIMVTYLAGQYLIARQLVKLVNRS